LGGDDERGAGDVGVEPAPGFERDARACAVADEDDAACGVEGAGVGLQRWGDGLGAGEGDATLGEGGEEPTREVGFGGAGASGAIDHNQGEWAFDDGGAEHGLGRRGGERFG
jgi:hypothetical protein